MAQANVGKVVLIPKGTWSNSTTYNFLDFVLYRGSSFVSKVNGNVGHEPSSSDTTNWQVLANAADEVTVESQTLAYASQSASAFTGNPPTTGWQTTVPDVGAGNYLWVRTTTEFSDGNSFNSYNVTKYGTNGTGTGTVTGAKLGASGTLIEPDDDGVVTFAVDATPTDSSTNLVLSGGIAQRIYQVVSATVARLTSGTTRKVYIHEGATQSDIELSDISTAFTITLSATWTNKAQTVSDARFKASGFSYEVSPSPSNFKAYGEAQIYADNVTTDGQMTFHCEEVPSGALVVNVRRSVV